MSRVPFKAVYDPNVEELVLSGDLDGSAEVLVALDAFTKKFAKDPVNQLLIITDEMRIIPEGVEVWVRTVDGVLTGSDLFYKSSQLSMILKYDPRYDHIRGRSTFIGTP